MLENNCNLLLPVSLVIIIKMETFFVFLNVQL